MIKGYRSTLNHVIALLGPDLTFSKVISRMFSSFEKSCPPREVKPLEWNLSLILKSVICPPYKPVKLSLDKHLTWKTFLLLGLCPKGLTSCMASLSESDTQKVGGLLP